MLKTNIFSNSRPSRNHRNGIADPREAMTIERALIWAYQDQQVDAIVGRGGQYMRVVGIDSARRAGDRMALGCEVMGGGYARLTVHPDAEALHDAVRRLRPPARIGLVIRHAKAGTRPDWLRGARPTVKPLRRPNGKIVVERDNNRNATWCPFVVDPLPQHIAFCHAVYAEWWDALDELVGAGLRLVDHVILPLGEPREPWKAKGLDFTKNP